jgi:hypothetical protein
MAPNAIGCARRLSAAQYWNLPTDLDAERLCWVADGVQPADLVSYTGNRRTYERRTRGARRT